MTDDVRVLYRPGRGHMSAGDGLPRGKSPAAKQARAEMADFLDASLMRPLWSSNEHREAAIFQALETMTIPERMFIELEMRERERVVHSFDYDPLAY
jgi:hypothetical protein